MNTTIKFIESVTLLKCSYCIFYKKRLCDFALCESSQRKSDKGGYFILEYIDVNEENINDANT